MGFGNKITDYAQTAIGSYGYTVKIDTTALLFENIADIQAQASASSTPAPSIGEVPLSTLMGYLNDVNCPNLSYNFSNGEITICFNTIAFPYVDATRFALFGLRKAQAATSDGDFLDFPDKDRRLALNYALREAYEIIKGKCPQDIQEIIDDEELRVKNE